MYGFSLLNGCATGDKSLVKNKIVRILLSSAESSAGSAWYINPQTGQVNYNNGKYNGYVVRPVVALDRGKINGWMEAYADCLSNKMTSPQCALYRMNDTDLIELMRECEERRYIPSTSICFCVTTPKIREIFAADFRDRIVQHWICQRLEPIFEKRFKEQGNVSWNCRKGCGTQKAVLALQRDIIGVSEGYTREAWVGRFDIVSFFMSIDIRILERLAVTFVQEHYFGDDKDLLIYLLTVTIRHRPQYNCEKRGDLSLWNKIQKGKSLFEVEQFRGMPIGNITSQLLANFYLSFFDDFMTGMCKSITARYERFVDDFAVVCRTKNQVLMLRDKAEEYLRNHLNLRLHHDKQYIQDVTKGVYFVGSVIKMHRMYISNRSVGSICYKLRKLQAILEDIENKGSFTIKDAYTLAHYQSSLNSYLGFMRDKNSYAIRRKVFSEHCPLFFEYFYVEGNFNIVRIHKDYTIKNQLTKTENNG